MAFFEQKFNFYTSLVLSQETMLIFSPKAKTNRFKGPFSGCPNVLNLPIGVRKEYARRAFYRCQCRLVQSNHIMMADLQNRMLRENVQQTTQEGNNLITYSFVQNTHDKPMNAFWPCYFICIEPATTVFSGTCTKTIYVTCTMRTIHHRKEKMLRNEK